MLDKIESDVRNDIENNLQDSDTDYIVDKPIPENKEESHQLLTPEAAVHFDGYVFYMDEPPAKKLKKEVVELKWKGTSKLVKMKKVHTRIKHIIRHSRKLQPIADLKIENSIFNSETYVRQSKSICYRERETVRYISRSNTAISYFMSISKLPNVKCYWSVKSYLSNDGVRKAMTRNRFITFFKMYILLITKQLINLTTFIRWVLP